MLCTESRSGDVKPNDALCGRCADSARCGNSRIRSVVKYVSSISTVYGAETSTYPGTECRHCTGARDVAEASGTLLLVAKDDGVPKRVLHDSSKALPYRGRRYVDTGTGNRELRTVRPQTPHWHLCIFAGWWRRLCICSRVEWSQMDAPDAHQQAHLCWNVRFVLERSGSLR